MAARGGLGKGLDSLIPKKVDDKKEAKEVKAGSKSKAAVSVEKEAKEAKGPETIVKITKVEPNRKQPRKYFNEDALHELAESIKQVGVLQPILVQERKDKDNFWYEIIAGERRWRAAKLAGLKEVPVIIRNYTEQQIVEIALIENIQREDLNPIEEAQTYKRLIEEFNMKQDKVAERVAKSRSAVTNSMRLLKLSDEVQQMLIDEMITSGHARALINIENPEEQYALAQKFFDEKLSVREAEKLVNKLKNPGKPKAEKKKDDESLQLIYQNIEENLKKKLSTKVSISSKGKGAGKIEIEFYNHEDLDRLLEMIGNQ